jgi:hypothetical protein
MNVKYLSIEKCTNGFVVIRGSRLADSNTIGGWVEFTDGHASVADAVEAIREMLMREDVPDGLVYGGLGGAALGTAQRSARSLNQTGG